MTSPARWLLARLLIPVVIGAVALSGTLVLLPDASAQNEPPNILLLIADDIGVESSVCYDDFPAPAPRLEAFCDEAVVFDNAWSSPICSPTRAGILTGRHSFRTGIGEQAGGGNGLEIADSEYTLPEVLDLANTDYATANFGKWHLGGGADKPNLMGWDHFSGLLAGGLNNYSNWTQVTNGETSTNTTYSTTAYVNEALDWIDEQDTPWLSWVTFNAPHTPFHLPPADLHTQNLSGTAADIDVNPKDYYHAAVEALDTEIGRLIDSLDPATRDNTTIFFVGDNGNPTQVSDFGRGAAKGSIQEGGIHVPFMVWGAGVDGGRTSDALVGTIDIFATALELAGVDYTSVIPGNVQIDSKSFAHTLAHADGGVNEYIMSELFGILANDNREGKTIRNDRYKVILFDNGNTRFYDLAVDRTSENPINAANRTAAEQAAYDELAGVLTAWTASADAPPPDPLPHEHEDPTPTPDGPTPTPIPGGTDLTALPLGDDKISTEPKVGEVFSCRSNFNGGGAQNVGPWIDEAAGTWDLTAKTVTVDGSVSWTSEFDVTLVGDSRMVSMNDLPNHPTGIFPVQSSDDAFFYDRNPNTITAQSIVESMPAIPGVAAQAACAPASVGFLLSGGLMFDGLDARGHDAAAHEIQDDCGGHPQSTGVYHYHSLTPCIDDPNNGEHSPLVGYAFDGFGIYGHYGEDGRTMTNADLDECHGHTHSVMWDGVERSIYHYHATWEYPYTVSCFRGEQPDPNATPTPVPTATPTLTPVETAAPTATPNGGIPGADTAEHVMVVVTCLADNGRVDINTVNVGNDEAAYRVEYGSLSARQTTLVPGDWWRMPITGRPDGPQDLLVTRNGVTIYDDAVTVACDGAESVLTGAEIQVVNSCRAGNGYILFQFVNASDVAKPYVIAFEGVPNRSTTAAAWGGAVRAVTGRPDNSFDVTIRSGSSIVSQFAVTVDCD